MKRTAAVAAVLVLVGCAGPTVVNAPALPIGVPAGRPSTTVGKDVFVQREWVATVVKAGQPTTLAMLVPSGWPERKGGEYWSDLTAPNSRIRMRIDITGAFGQAPLLGARAMADRHLDLERAKTDTVRVIRDRLVGGGPFGPFGDMRYELVYRYSLNGKELEATYRFTGTSAITTLELSVHYPPDLAAEAVKVLDTTEKSAAWLRT